MAKAVVLNFGKHKGKSVDEVLFIDPDYFAWLQAQSDLLLKKPDVARALTELGVSGDNTPIHNALQAMFLDDAICEKLFRQLIRRDADAAIRHAVLMERRKRVLGPLFRPDHHTSSKTRRRGLLDEKLNRAAALKDLDQALSGSDEELTTARKAAKSPTAYPWYGLRALYFGGDENVRERAEQERVDLAASVESKRQAILEMRTKIVEARKEVARLRSEDVLIRFTVEERRMEERNGTDVRVRCSLSAKAPKAFDKSDRVDWTLELWLEIKPYVSDDYPNLLRQMTTQRRLAQEIYTSGERRFVAVVGRYGGHGATLGQVRQMLKEAGFSLVLLEDMGCELPKVTVPSAQSVGELPLFS